MTTSHRTRKSPAPGRWTRHLLAATAGLGLALGSGCGGGVDTGGTGITISSVALGPISGFGSIVVAGVHYDERGARIEDDSGRLLDAQALQLGALTLVEAGPVATVAGVPTAEAKTLRVLPNLVGPVQSVDTGACELRVLGQRVAAVATTVLDASMPTASGSCRIGAVAMGQVVEAHGSWDLARGRLAASRLALRASSDHYVLSAVVDAYAPASGTVTLGGQVLSLAGLAGSAPALQVGGFARARLATAQVGGRWVVGQLSDAAPPIAAVERVELEGRISAFTSATRFSLNGVVVDASGASFPNGQAGMAVGTKVEAKGRASGQVLVADTVAVDGSSDEDSGAKTIELEGRITAVDAAAQRFVLRGTTVSYAASPVIEGGTTAALTVNRKVHVKGRLGTDGMTVVATKIEISD